MAGSKRVEGGGAKSPKQLLPVIISNRNEKSIK
jgi:hypothetical protein